MMPDNSQHLLNRSTQSKHQQHGGKPWEKDLSFPQHPFSTRTLKVEGLDQTGIVFKVSKYLAEKKVNIADLNSFISSAPESGTAIYSVDMQIQIPEGVSMDAFSQGLDKIAAALNVDMTLV